MDPPLKYTSGNRTSWDGIAAARPAKPAQFFLDGNVTLDQIELNLLGDVRDKSLLHLACANGNDSLSWAVRGANVTGVDISEVAVTMAKNAAEAAGLGARFVTSDIYALPEDLGTFDIVISVGERSAGSREASSRLETRSELLVVPLADQ